MAKRERASREDFRREYGTRTSARINSAYHIKRGSYRKYRRPLSYNELNKPLRWGADEAQAVVMRSPRVTWSEHQLVVKKANPSKRRRRSKDRKPFYHRKSGGLRADVIWRPATSVVILRSEGSLRLLRLVQATHQEHLRNQHKSREKKQSMTARH